MYKEKKSYFIRTISSLHAGSGNDLGVIDLPIQREKHTSFPKIESSSLKGSIREAFEKNVIDETKIHLTFGFDGASASDGSKTKFNGNDEFSGCLAFTDARLLLFPVRSAKGVFAFITCPYVLKRYNEDMKIAGSEDNIDYSKINPAVGECIVSNETEIEIKGNVILEEYNFKVNSEKFNFKNFPAGTEILKKTVILNDDDFKDFVNLSTEVITRTKIDNETGTVARGALFNEEYLPPETIMYFLVFASTVFQKEETLKNEFKDENAVMEFFSDGIPEYFQIGGNATFGKGIVNVMNKEEK